MAEYVSRFTGQEIDNFLQKSKDIAKTASEINNSMALVDKVESGINSAKVGEIVAKNASGGLEGVGIINEADKIFFPKDGRFPSGSIDVGPAITISENGGWVQNHTNTLDNDYIFLDYEVDKTGSKRPSYAKRDAEELNVIINGANLTTMQNVVTFEYMPAYAAQINALYFDFATPVTNLRAEIVSKLTNLPIKYIPNEQAWKSGNGGLNIPQGVHNVLDSYKQTPFSALTSYQLKINIIADGPVTLMGNGVLPYMAADVQRITEIGVLLLGEGTGSPDEPSQIRDKLILLSGNDRLSITALKDIPEGLIAETSISIRDKLETLVSDNRLSHTAIKDLVLFDIVLNAKLSGIEEGAEVNPTASEIKSLYESNVDTNAFDDASKSKLDSITGGRFLGVFQNLTALQIAYPTGTLGDAATVTDPNSNLFYWDGTTWTDSGTGFIGDMIKSVYDPTNKHIDVYSMDNMDETATKKILTDAERLKLVDIESGAEVNVQSDWANTDMGSDAYIKNKPVIYNSVGGGYITAEVITTCTLANTFYKVNAVLTPWDITKDFVFDAVNNRINYIGTTQNILSNVCLSVKSNTNNTILGFAIFKNGSEILSTRMFLDFPANGKSNNVALASDIQLQNGDYLDIRVTSDTANILATFSNMQITLR